jgi:hypothetical protein
VKGRPPYIVAEVIEPAAGSVDTPDPIHANQTHG